VLAHHRGEVGFRRLRCESERRSVARRNLDRVPQRTGSSRRLPSHLPAPAAPTQPAQRRACSFACRRRSRRSTASASTAATSATRRPCTPCWSPSCRG